MVKFELGDRVVNYGRARHKGRITAITVNGQSLMVRHDLDGFMAFYPRQVLRKLKTKKKQPLLEKWVVVDECVTAMAGFYSGESEAKNRRDYLNDKFEMEAPHRVVHLREVRKKK